MQTIDVGLAGGQGSGVHKIFLREIVEYWSGTDTPNLQVTYVVYGAVPQPRKLRIPIADFEALIAAAQAQEKPKRGRPPKSKETDAGSSS